MCSGPTEKPMGLTNYNYTKYHGQKVPFPFIQSVILAESTRNKLCNIDWNVAHVFHFHSHVHRTKIYKVSVNRHTYVLCGKVSTGGIRNLLK